MVDLLKKVKTNPCRYIRKAVDPRWWSTHYTEQRRRQQRQKEFEEVQNVQSLLYQMWDGSLVDATSYREQKLLRFLKYATEHCPYYRDIFRQVGFSPKSLSCFEDIPLLDKTIVRRFQKELTSDVINSLNFYAMNTGGSTGEPLEFPVSRIAGLIDKVHQEFVCREIMQYQPGDIIVAFDGSSVPAKSLDAHRYWVVKSDQDASYGRLSYSSLYLRAETLHYYIRHILDTAPCIFRGYPSFINDIAEYILKNNVSIPFRIKGIQLTAENTHDWQIENIRKAFNTRVFLQYGHSEVCVYGYTLDDTYEYYCSPFYGFTEVLGEDGKHVKLGDVGEVVVTGFHNFAMPFLRYRTGDLAIFAGDVGGIIRLQKIVGRTQDCIFTKNGEKVALTALIFGQHYHAFRNIQKWQLQQDIPGKVKVRIIKGEGFSSEDEMEIQCKFRDICDVDTEFEYIDYIPVTSRGKFRFLIQNVQA